ncbi:hypothetical protein GGI20_001830 [Coemansia sp. BCRC 34301]|nr:hypothetical protein GGI20_001830 [Coemansia sp. BCRC 34301]
MADIERKILQQADCDEDDAERSRARENGDDDRQISSDAGAESTIPTTTHDGPQTGAKGVMADYRHACREQRQRMEQEAAAAKADYAGTVAMRSTQDSSGGQTLWVKDATDSECDDNDDNVFFEEYRRKRVAELSHAADTSLADALIDATPSEYVEIVDQEANSGASVVTVLVNGSAVSRRLEDFIRAVASKYAHAIFVRVQAAECGFVDSDLVPIVLVYRHGELEHNLVRVVDSLGGPTSFEQRDVSRLLDKVLQR